ncbi:hypothetical protein C8F01DRAFT_1144243 [Mycena amicta]|nr:hypothetical protein C8F01DRAFT_1144243 [Mycena amicta]
MRAPNSIVTALAFLWWSVLSSDSVRQMFKFHRTIAGLELTRCMKESEGRIVSDVAVFCSGSWPRYAVMPRRRYMGNDGEFKEFHQV